MDVQRTLAITILTAITAAGGSARADDDPCAEPTVPVDPHGEPAPIDQTTRPCAEPAIPPVPKDRFRLQGTIIGKSDRQPLAGATLVAEHVGTVGDVETAITDEHGWYKLDVTPGTYTITVYFTEATTILASGLVVASDFRLGTLVMEDTYYGGGCVFWEVPPVEMRTNPKFGLDVSRTWLPVSRDRTHRAWIAPVVGADARTAVTTIESGPRLQSAPGIPIAFVEGVTTYTLRTPISLGAGAGGATEVALRSGSNTVHGDAHLGFGIDHEANATTATEVAELYASGPLSKDEAWIATGLAADRDPQGVVGADAMLRVDYAKSWAHQLSVAGLAQSHGETNDGWANARWTSKLDDAHVELKAIATAEQLALPMPSVMSIARVVDPTADVTNRVGGRVDLVYRFRGLGHHQVSASAGGGAGYRGEIRHDDATLAAGDEWQVKPNLEFHYGVRSDSRAFGDAHAMVVSPRLAIVYDFTQEGRSDIFVAYQRVPHLDDGLPGDWSHAATRFHDEVAGGVSYHRNVDNPIMVGVAGRSRWSVEQAEAELGAEAWVRIERRRTSIHAAATALGRVASLVGQHTVFDRRTNKLLTRATLRAAPTATTSNAFDLPASSAAAAVMWRHDGKSESGVAGELNFDLSLEGYASERGPGGRILLGGSW